MFQLHRDLAAFNSANSGHTAFSVQAILEKWQLFCDKPPKGFEKYYKGKEDKSDAKAEDKQADTAGSSPPSSKSAPMSKPPGADAKSSKNNDWNFGMFNPTSKSSSGGGGGGRPIGGDGNGDREKWLIAGALGVAGLLGMFAFMEMNYREIGWKEFVNTYVVMGLLI